MEMCGYAVCMIIRSTSAHIQFQRGWGLNIEFERSFGRKLRWLIAACRLGSECYLPK